MIFLNIQIGEIEMATKEKLNLLNLILLIWQMVG